MQKKFALIIVYAILSVGAVSGASRWRECVIPQTVAQFTFIDFADSLDGVIFSKYGVYAMTADGGMTWKVDSLSLAGEVSDVKYFGKEHCWIQTDSNYYAMLYYSSGGNVWVRRRLPDTLRYLWPACGFATEQRLFINSGRAILGSNDGGMTWDTIISHAYGTFHSIGFADSLTGIATFSTVGASGETALCLSLRTTDGGAKWDTLKAGDTAYDHVHFYTPKIGSMMWSYSSMEAMWFRTGMSFTNDGGKTFHDIQTAATGGYYPDQFLPMGGVEFDGSHRFILASDSQMKPNVDGLFIVTRNDPAGIGIISFESLSERSNWILAMGNRLFQSVDVPTDVTSPNNSQHVTEMRLNQNYPNPFNPSTQITFTLPVRSHVVLSVSNILGQRVATLVSGELPAGTHTRQWNASGMPSGMYFYRLEAGGFTETKRLVVVK